MKFVALAVLSLAIVASLRSGDLPDSGPASAPIRDNSFLLEEAYNQERGVIQHIGTFQRVWSAGEWASTFTEEWPVGGPRHQLSVTLPYLSVPGESRAHRGIGDVALNYRIQAAGLTGGPLAFAPRLSLLAPSGNSGRGHGSGDWGVQVNLPLSAEIGRRMVTHWNAGATHWSSARNETGESASLTTANLGGSVIWLAHPRLNLMLEGLWTRNAKVVAAGQTRHFTEACISPGLRWRHNFSNGLEIVPGLAFPISIAGGSRSGVFLYVSFEHPLSALGR